MKYTIGAVNQFGLVNSGLIGKIDLVDLAILDYICELQLTASAVFFNNMVCINYKHLLSEMPLLGLNNKSAISKRIKKIRDLGLLDTYQDPQDGRIYGKTTDFYFDVCRIDGRPHFNSNGGV
jgi:hypothetical protein